MRRCPSCNEDLDIAPLPDLPRSTTGVESLQDPAFPQDPRARKDDTAPVSEFVAAGAVLGGVLLLVAGAVMMSGVLALLGVFLMFGVTGFFAFYKGSLGRAVQHYRSTMWGGRHPDEAASRDDRRRRGG